MISAEKPNLRELPRIGERTSFVYLEYCRIGRTDSAVEVSNDNGIINLPSATIGALLLGPGTTITHRAMELLGDSGTSILWVGESGVRYYASGSPLTHSSTLLMAQAKAVSNKRLRMNVAREMYQMRFPGEDVSHLTMQQLRGREGARVRRAYRNMSAETGVEWVGRRYDPNSYDSGDVVNKALSTANSCLYGMVHSVIVALGCSPGLGFVHTGHEKSFVYDIADLYKTEITIPLAFRIASSVNGKDVGPMTRRAFRDTIASTKLMERIASDIKHLLKNDEEKESLEDVNRLWDGSDNSVDGGMNYGEDVEE